MMFLDQAEFIIYECDTLCETRFYPLVLLLDPLLKGVSQNVSQFCVIVVFDSKMLMK